jgi:L-alanine-DL-glutamate epimerase-like enolase superfamily enzyme
MRIAELSTLVVRQPVKNGAINFKFGALNVVESLIIKLTTEEGKDGFGVIEATPPLGLPAASILPILGIFRDAVVGKEVVDHLRIMSQIKQRLFSLNYSFNPVLAAIDTALHDLAAHLAGVSLCKYLGCDSSGGSVETLDVIPLSSKQQTQADIATSIAKGKNAVKLKLTGDGESDISRVRHVREVFGNSLQIYCDANGSYEYDKAQDAAALLAKLGVVSFEQPVTSENLDAMAALTASSNLPVEADESVCSKSDALSLISQRAADIMSLRISRFGGIQETIYIAQKCIENSIAFRFGAMFTPSLQNAVSAHIALALPKQRYAHEFSMHDMFLNDPFEGLETSDGKIVIDPTKLGIGLKVRSDCDKFCPIPY